MRLLGLSILPLMLIVCTACSDVAVFLGLRTRLDKLPVTSITASLVRAGSAQPIASLAPGQAGQLVVVANTADGKHLATVGAGHGTILFDSFAVSANLVQVDAHGHVLLPSDPRLSEGKTPNIHVDTVGHPGRGHGTANQGAL